MAIGTGKVLEAEVDHARRRGPYYPDASAPDSRGSAWVHHFQGTVGRRYELYSLGRDRAGRRPG
jgi:general secretion pathway protein G